MLRRLTHYALRRMGYELRSRQLGTDPYFDIGQLLRNAGVAFDIGANTGQTINALLATKKFSQIHAFEPSPITFAELSTHHGQTDNVRLNCCAVGSRSERRDLNENIGSDMSSFLPLGPDGWGHIEKRTTVPVITVDDYCAENNVQSIDLLKTDTQGFDLEVLRGADTTLRSNRVRLVLLEISFFHIYSGAPSFEEIRSFLSERHFHLFSIYEMHIRDNRAGWTDAMFINPDYSPHLGGDLK
jgi:FkbM family methyltransferase